MEITNTLFKNINYNIRSVIFSEFGTVALTNTDFININTYSCDESFAIIISKNGKFIYQSGLVNLESTHVIPLFRFASGFLIAENMDNVIIT